MQHQLTWKNKEEGIVCFLEENKEWISFNIFVLGEEVEFTINSMMELEKLEFRFLSKEEICSKLEDCFCKTFELLWKTGFEEVIFVDNSKSKIAPIVKEIESIEQVYSEYMMKKQFWKGEYLEEAKNNHNLCLRMEGENYDCEDVKGDFTCRLSPYQDGFYLYEVEVKKRKRNRGIATRCLKQLFSKLLEKKSELIIYLQVGSYNEPALHLYQKLGFELLEEICYYTIKEDEEER